MIRRARLWQIVAAVFTALNIAGAGFAAAGGEVRHAALHIALAVLGSYLVWRLTPGAGEREQSSGQLTDVRLEQLQQSVDAIAIEVERIGEAQRFNAKLQAERTSPDR